MATRTATIDSREVKPDELDIEFWKNHSIGPLKSLLRAAGTYTDADQEAQVRILSQHVIPNLGPRPSKASGPSFMTQSGSPLQLSLNASRYNCVRYCWDMLGVQGPVKDDPLVVEVVKDTVAALCAAFGFTTRWSNVFIYNFAVTQKEAQKIADMLPEWMKTFVPEGVAPTPLTRIPFGMTAFDLKGSTVSMKFYINPKPKEIITGMPATGAVWDILRSLSPRFQPDAIDTLERFIAGLPGPSPIEMICIDCVDEARLSEARIKLYLASGSSSFNTVENYVTLGNRIQNQETQQYLAALRKLWHLLLQEPQGIPGDDFEKPINESSLPSQKLYFSLELRPGDNEPKVKTYLPVWKYVRTDQETVDNYEEIFRLCDHPWGEKGKYRRIFTDAFGPPNHGRAKPVHCDTSFMFTEKDGIYQTVYFNTPLKDE